MLIEQYFPRYKWLIIQFAIMLRTGLNVVHRMHLGRTQATYCQWKARRKTVQIFIWTMFYVFAYERIVTILQVQQLCKYYIGQRYACFTRTKRSSKQPSVHQSLLRFFYRSLMKCISRKYVKLNQY